MQLVGVAATFIASKYEEINVQDINDYVYCCVEAFTKRQILDMEVEILSKLNWELSRPYSLHFLRRYNKVAHAGSEHHNLAKLFLDIMLAEYELCHLQPSLQAAAACCLSMAVMQGSNNPAKVWSPVLVKHTGYEFAHIESVVLELATYAKNVEQATYNNIVTKYSRSRYGKVGCNGKLKGPVLNNLGGQSPELLSTEEARAKANVGINYQKM